MFNSLWENGKNLKQNEEFWGESNFLSCILSICLGIVGKFSLKLSSHSESRF